MGLIICDIPGSCEHRVECENRDDTTQITQMLVCAEADEQTFIRDEQELVDTLKTMGMEVLP